MQNCALDRRAFLAAAIGASVLLPANAQQTQNSPAAISPTAAPRDWSPGHPMPYPDPDLVAIDPRFRRYIINSQIQRLQTGAIWSEGPAWNGVGRYLVWSDIPNNVQMRWIEEDGRITTFRNPSGYSNGNLRSIFEGRQLSVRTRRASRRPLRGRTEP